MKKIIFLLTIISLFQNCNKIRKDLQENGFIKLIELQTN